MKSINHWDSDRVRMFCQSWWLGFQVGGGRGGEISGKSFVHIRRVHIGGFSPPVEKYFITRRVLGKTQRERSCCADWASGDGVPRTLPGHCCGTHTADPRASEREREGREVLLASFVRAATWTRDAGELLNELGRREGRGGVWQGRLRTNGIGGRPKAGTPRTHPRTVRAELFTWGNEGSVRVVHEIYRSLGLRRIEIGLSIMKVMRKEPIRREEAGQR